MVASLGSVEFTGQPAFNWWAAVVAAIGLALLVYAVLLRREGRRPASPVGHDLGRSAAADLLAPPPVVTVFGRRRG